VRSMTIRGRLLLSLGLALVGALSVAASANALTLGQVAPPNLGGSVSGDVFQLKVGAGAPKYRVPAGPTGLWTIDSWSAQGGGSANGRARLRVYRRTQTGGQFKLVKQSDLKTVPKDGSPSFATSLNVRQGDLLGLGTVSEVPVAYGTTFTGSDVKILGCDPTGVGQLVGAGTTCPLFDYQPGLVNVAATLTPR
jgi:hypothetical protein